MAGGSPATPPLINIGEVVTHAYFNRFKEIVFPAYEVGYLLLQTILSVTEDPERFLGDLLNDQSQKYEVVSINDPRMKISPLGELPIITTFGDLTTAKRVPFINSQFYLGLEADETLVIGDPLVTIDGDVGFENLLKITTGALAGVNIGSIESKDGLRYIPGYEFGVWFTSVYKPPTVDGFIKTGLWDGNNGFWIGYKLHEGSIQFGICRVKNGTEFFTPQSEFNMDKMDGMGLSKFLINPELGNIYLIRGGYLGFAPMVFSVKLPGGQILPFHIIKYPNSSDVTHISNTNLPVKADLDNGTADEIVSVKIGSISAFVSDGASVAANVRKFSRAVSGTTASGVHSRRTLAAFKNSGIYSGGLLPTPKAHRISAILDFLGVTLDNQNKNVLLEILIVPNAANTGGTFVPVDPDSILDSSLDATYDFVTYPPEIIFATSFRSGISDKTELFLSELQLRLRPGEHGIFVLTSQTTLAIDFVFTNVWSELW